MTALRWMIMALCLAALTTGTACGRKGDPVRPATASENVEDDENKDSGY